jgi:hypothetical protein
LTRDYRWEFLLLHRLSFRKMEKKDVARTGDMTKMRNQRTCTKRTRAVAEDFQCLVVFGQRTASPTLFQYRLSNTTWLGSQCLLSRTGTLEMKTMTNELRLHSASGRSMGHGR